MRDYAGRRILVSARIRRAMICELHTSRPQMRIKESPLWFNVSKLWIQHVFATQSIGEPIESMFFGRHVDARIRQVVFDEGGGEETIRWICDIVGDAK